MQENAAEKKAISNEWFYKLYGIYGGIFLLICAGILAVCRKDFYENALVPAALALIALLLFFFVLSIKKGVLAIFTECGKTLDQAIAGQVRQPEDEETELAVFQAKLARFVGIRQKALQDAKMQKEQIETLFSDISHQTKTPIANILMYSQLLQERGGEEAELAAKLVSQSEKLKFLIQRLIEMARMENGIIKCVPRRENLREFCVQVIGDFYDKAQAKNLEITLDCPPDITAVFDEKWTREAVGNLLDNGIKYTPPGGRIQVAATAYQLFARIEIADSGIGISEEEIPKIFQRFYRAGKVSKEEGLGLGLYLAREIAQAQGGYIKVLSEKGRGSRFQVFLPVENEK